MVPDRMGRESLGLLFAKDLFVAPITSRYLGMVVVILGGV